MNKKRPKFSVCMPTFNRAVYIKEALESVLSQDFNDYEIIVVDDGSDDNTKQIVEEIKSDKLNIF